MNETQQDYHVKYPLIYTGLMLSFKKGKRCREIIQRNGHILIEFEDLRRDWAYSRDLQPAESISSYELSTYGAR